MAYTYTERKRIRKNFGSRDSVLKIPYLLQMQKDAYTAFLQADVSPKKRTREGLQAAFEAAFPIVSHNGFVEMKYLEYNLAKPGFDVRECQTRGLTFASAVRAKVQLFIYDRESSTSQNKVIKEVKEQEVYMGEVPLMTTKGSFIINGTARVIVSQLHRSPGVFFEHDKGKTTSSGQWCANGICGRAAARRSSPFRYYGQKRQGDRCEREASDGTPYPRTGTIWY